MPVNQGQIRQASGETIRQLRHQAGISQETLAYESGLERAHLSGLERGKYAPNMETIFKLLPVLQVSLTEYAQEFETSLRRIRRAPKAKPEPPPASE